MNYYSATINSATENWCGHGGPQDAPFLEYGHITSKDFKKMRSGSYNKAPKKIQEKWKFVGLNLITKVNASWSKADARREKLMSNVISLSDEVIVEWYFYVYFQEWKKKHEKLTKAKQDKTLVAKIQQRKKKGEEHASKKYLCPFFIMMSDLNKKHCAKDKTEISTWDEALKDEEKNRLKQKQQGKRTQQEMENDENGTAAMSGGKQKKGKEWHDGYEGFDPSNIIYGKGSREEV